MKGHVSHSGEFQCIAQQIIQNLAQPQRITVSAFRQRRIHVQGEAKCFLHRLRPVGQNDLLQQLMEVICGVGKIHHPRADAGPVECIIEQAHEMPCRSAQ